MDSRTIVREFLDAVEALDLGRLGACFTAEARYANVPNPPATGPAAIRSMFEPILGRAERVRWDLVGEVYLPDRALLERVDRFWIDGTEYAIECNGVFVVDTAAGRIAEVRDYVDLATWRQRLATAHL